MVLAAALFAVNGTVSKLVLGSGLSTLRLVQIRSTGAAVLLCVLALALDRGALRIRRGELGFLLATGSSASRWCSGSTSWRSPGSPSASHCSWSSPPRCSIALWMRFVLRRPVASRVWPALVLVLAGLALVARCGPASPSTGSA